MATDSKEAGGLESSEAFSGRPDRISYIDSLDQTDLRFVAKTLLDSLESPFKPKLHQFDPTNVRASTPPDVQSADPTGRISLLQYGVDTNDNWRSRCGCDSSGTCDTNDNGLSYVSMDYGYGQPHANYAIIVRIRRYQYHTWDDFIGAHAAYCLFATKKWLTGPGAPGREGYFNTGNNQTPQPNQGTLGVEAWDKAKQHRLWWGLWWLKQFPRWGENWLHCGMDYCFWFGDA